MLVCVFCLCIVAHETAGAARTRSSLRPLLLGRMILQNSGASRGGNEELRPVLLLLRILRDALLGRSAPQDEVLMVRSAATPRVSNHGRIGRVRAIAREAGTTMGALIRAK